MTTVPLAIMPTVERVDRMIQDALDDYIDENGRLTDKHALVSTLGHIVREAILTAKAVGGWWRASSS
jgi:hypothetical protein